MTLLNVRLHFKAERPQLKSRRHPHTVRRAVGAAMKNSICAFSPSLSCSQCVLAESCPYTRILLPAIAWPAPGCSTPRPVIFRPAPAGDAGGPSLRTAWDVILVGTGWQYLKYILRALSGKGLGDQGAFPWGAEGGWELQEAMLLHPQGEMPLDIRPITDQYAPSPGIRRHGPSVSVPSHMVIWGNSLTMAAPQRQSNPAPAGEDILRLNFKTRTRLKRRGRYLTRPPQFPLLIRHLLRRVAGLSALYTGRRLTIAWPRLLEQAAQVQLVDHDLRWSRWSRSSGRSPGRVMHRSGFTGSVYYRGPWQPFGSLLALGTYVHVGQGATFGGGQFTVHLE